MSLPFTQFLIKKKKKNRVFFLDPVCLDMLKIFKLFPLGGDVSRHEPIIKMSLPKPAPIREAFIRKTGNFMVFYHTGGTPPPLAKFQKYGNFWFFCGVFKKSFSTQKFFFDQKHFQPKNFFNLKNSFNQKFFS